MTVENEDQDKGYWNLWKKLGGNQAFFWDKLSINLE